MCLCVLTSDGIVCVCVCVCAVLLCVCVRVCLRHLSRLPSVLCLPTSVSYGLLVLLTYAYVRMHMYYVCVLYCVVLGTHDNTVAA